MSAGNLKILYVNFSRKLLVKDLLKGQFSSVRKSSSYFHQTSSEPLVYKTIAQLVEESVEKYGSREALVDCTKNVRLSFDDANKRAENLALGLVELGFKPGDRIGLWGPNTAEWFISSLATAKAGLVAVDINPAYQSNELLYCIQSVGLKGIIMDETFKTQNYLEILKKALPDMKCLGEDHPVQSVASPTFTHVIINSEKKFDGTFNFKDVESKYASPNHRVHLLHTLQSVQADDGCIIQFTSGTTGSPKAALLSHFNVVNNAHLVAKRQTLFDEKHKICIQVPFFHIYGQVVGILGCFGSGTTLVLPSPSFNPEASIQALEKERCTGIYGTPTMYVDLLAKARQFSAEQRKEKFEALQFSVTGGASIAPSLMEDMKQMFGLKRSMQVYGMTETSPVTFLHPADDQTCEQMPHSVGKVLEHTEVKVVDADKKMVPFGQKGELLIRAYCNMLRYWGNEEKTKEIISEDNWLRTGDQFILTEDGFGQVVGRIKDLIIRGGENIYPLEIEDFLITHPQILEVYVYGVKDERMGEEIGASIRLKENSHLREDELRAYCKGKISHFKIPKFVEFVKSFPTTTSGKIQKFILKESMEKKLGV